MISWTIPVPTTVSPETYVTYFTEYGQYYSTTTDNSVSFASTKSTAITASTITQSNGNTLVMRSEEISSGETLIYAGSEESTVHETAGVSYTSFRTNGEVLSATAIAELSLIGTSTSREATSISGTRTTTTTEFGVKTQVQTTFRTLWTTANSAGETTFTSYTASVQTTGTSIGSLTKVKTTVGVTTFTEYGMSGGGGGWPTYATATVLHLEPNEVAWICTTTSNQWANLSQIAQSYSASATVYPSFTTFVKNQSHAFDETANSNVAQSTSGTQAYSFSSHTNNTTQAVTGINTGAQAQIPFSTFTLSSISGQTTGLQIEIGTYGIAAGDDATKGIWTSTTAYVATRSTIVGNLLGEQSTAYPTTTEFTAPLGQFGQTQSEETTLDSLIDGYTIVGTTGRTTLIENTASNFHPLAFTVIQAAQPTRFEQSYEFAAAAFNDSIGSNLDLPLTIQGITNIAKLSQVAAIPYPSTYAGSIGTQPATITVGENVTVNIDGNTSSYDLGVVGDPIQRKSSKARDLRGGKGPLGQTLFIGPGAYEAFPDNGASFTTSYSAQVSFVETAEGVTNYRPLIQVLAQRGAGQRYLVQSYATTTVSTFF